MILSDRFLLGELLGTGGMGEVFAGYDQREARPVAVKRLRPDVARDPDAVRRFAREGALLRSTAHPNIVQVLAVVEAPTGPHIVMELVPGGTLHDRLRREPRLPLPDVLALALDLSDALARAHRLGVVHRDLKPANVLIAADGTPRLSDFGIASIAGTDSLWRPGLVVGTLPYLAPEGWDGDPADAAADIWALGVMLYEMLAGRRPFVAEQSGLLHAAIAVSEPVPLRQLRADTPIPLAEAISAMLVKDPTQRMRSVRELGLVVERLRDPDAGTAAPAHVAALPRAATALVGRERELAELRRLLTDPSLQLLTLTGPGGGGKTRLALATADTVRGHFRDGVTFVDLTAVTEPALVLPAIARALQVEEDLHRPLVELLAERLGPRRHLLVLDNFEQVLEAGPEIARLVAGAAGLTVLVTSRFRLRLAAERDYPVAPLPESDAVALFFARARAADPRLVHDADATAAAAGICRRLDGLPLAIELAAARARILPPRSLLEHLERPLELLTGGDRDRAPHQRTLRRTIAWSLRLLEPGERELFVRLAVFVGGWSLEDALAVVGNATEDLPGLVDGLQSLVERSLLTLRTEQGEPRYGMLETLREYARDALDERDDRHALRARHAAHFAQRAAAWSERADSAAQADALAWFAAAHENLRAALVWHEGHAREALPRLAAALGRFWYLGGHWHEGLGWYARALAAAPEAAAPERAALLDLCGRLEMFLGDETPARAHHEEAWTLVEQGGDARLRARVAEGLGEVLLKVGELTRATALLERSEALARESGDAGALVEALTTLATARVGEGRHAAAEALLTEALALARPRGEPFALTRLYYYLSGLGLLRDAPEAARAFAEEGRRVAAGSGDQAWASHLDEMFARTLLPERRWDEAKALLSCSLHAFDEVGSRSCLPHSFEAAARLCLAEAPAGDGGRWLSAAARLLGAADAQCRALAIAMLPVERALLGQTTDRVRDALGKDRFAEEWERGRGLGERDAVGAIAALLERGQASG